jgi:signal transduction histidine kinase
MRVLFGCLAVLLGAVSVLLAARYGYKGADTTVDGLISAVVFGAIALCAFIFDAAAVRLWFMRHRLGAVVIGTISAAALVVTFTNSLGAIAGRADINQAERVRASTEITADRAELKRLARERDAITLRPVTEEALSAAREAVVAAERIRLAECGNGDPRQRGPTAGHGRPMNKPSGMRWLLCSSTRQQQPGPPRWM